MTLSNKLALLLDEMGRGSQRRLAEYLGDSPVNVNRWVKGARPIPQKHLPKIAKFFGVSLDYLLDDEQQIPLNRFIPIIGKASCGVPNEYFGDEVEYMSVPANIYDDGTYAVIAEGSSMLPKIKDGDIVICNQDKRIESGDIVHYTINGESGIKKVKFSEDKNTIMLIPLNPSYEPAVFNMNEVEDIRMSKCTHIIASL